MRSKTKSAIVFPFSGKTSKETITAFLKHNLTYHQFDLEMDESQFSLSSVPLLYTVYFNPIRLAYGTLKECINETVYEKNHRSKSM